MYLRMLTTFGCGLYFPDAIRSSLHNVLELLPPKDYELIYELYFTALASYITLGEQGKVVLHTKTETEVTLDDGSNESS